MDYRIFWTNIGYYSPEKFASLREAADFAKSKGFEATISRANNPYPIASWTVFGGLREFS